MRTASGHGRRRAPIPVASDGERPFHPEPRPHHDGRALSSTRDDAAVNGREREKRTEGAKAIQYVRLENPKAEPRVWP